ncbi:hypothetical protein RLW55_12110 [Hyphomicrobium sp. B1]
MTDQIAHINVNAAPRPDAIAMPLVAADTEETCGALRVRHRIAM